MLEREAVTRAVGEVLHAARLGRGGALFIVGEAGLGKTTVLDYACRMAAPAARVGVARGDAMETGLPFGLLAQAVNDLGGANGVDGTGRVASPDDARASHFYRTLRWMQALAAESPVVVGVDDLHWSDGDSIVLLSYLCRRIISLPVAIVATLRPWPPAAEDMCLRLAAAGHARIERLTALTDQAARTLLVSRVGQLVTDDVIDRAAASAAGNPLLLEQVALAIERDGQSAQVVDGYQRGAHGLLLPRFGGLPEAGMHLARAATVLGSRFRPELAIALAHLDEDDATLALDALSRSGLVRHVGAGTAEFTHLLFQQALYNDLPPLVREDLHARAFRLLLQRGMETEAAEHAVRGNFLGDPEAVDVLVRAGRAALRAGAVTTAVERLEAAVRRASIQAGPELLLLLAEALLAEGRSARAARVYELVLEQSHIPEATRVDTLRMLGRALVMTGDDIKASRRFEEAARVAKGEHPLLARAMLDLSRAAWLTGGPLAARPAIDRARDMARLLDPSVRMEVEAAWGFVAFAAGDATGLEAAIAAGQWAEDNDSGVVGDLSWNWGTLRNAGRAAKYAERFTESEAVFSATYAQAERIGSPTAIVSLAAHQANSLCRQGRLDEALLHATRAVALAELAPMAEAFAYVVKALLLLLVDRVDESEDRCRQAETAAAARGQWLPLLRVWHLRALRHYHDGEIDQACALYTRLADRTAELGIGEPCLVPWARHAVVAHLSNGDQEQAAGVVAWVEACGAGLPCRWPRIAAAAGRARLAEARGDALVAEEEFRRALALHDEVSLPVERIETVWEWGSFLRRAGRLVEARHALREAVALAERTGVPWLARLVHEELAVAGGRRRRRDGDRQDLTAQEQRVAQLAAGGRSSTEIAGRLSLSVRTIETHLGRIYAKLGIHSQRELMAVRSGTLAGDPDAHRPAT